MHDVYESNVLGNTPFLMAWKNPSWKEKFRHIRQVQYGRLDSLCL
jgi:hypothetical protein